MKRQICAFHNREVITNFCNNQNCLLPLCPRCIKVHSDEHELEASYGEFANIEDVHQQISTDLRNFMKSLVSCSQDLKDIYVLKTEKRNELKEKMKCMRRKMMSAIDKYIDEVQKEILNTLGGLQTNMEEEFTVIDQKIDHVSKEVQKSLANLNSDKLLKTMIVHIADNKKQLFGDQIEDITNRIRIIESNDITSKDFKIASMKNVFSDIHSCYRDVFIGTIKKRKMAKNNSYFMNTSRDSEYGQ